MSAFICDRDIWKKVMKGIWDYGEQIRSQDEIDRTWQELVQANYDSVNFRYDEHNEPAAIDLIAPTMAELIGMRVDDEEIWDAIKCYQYQSCQTEDYFCKAGYYKTEWAKNGLVDKLLAVRPHYGGYGE